MQEVHKKASRKTISANPERQIFDIFTLVPTMVTSQGDAKLDKLLARPKKSWIRMFKSKKKMTHYGYKIQWAHLMFLML